MRLRTGKKTAEQWKPYSGVGTLALFACIAALLAGCASTGFAPPMEPMPQEASPLPGIVLKESVRFFHVHGSSSKELNRSIIDDGLIDGNDGTHVFADTFPHLEWTYVLAADGEQCDLDRLTMQLTIVTDLPKWDDPERSNSVMQNEWAEYLETLQRHERGHRNIAVEGVNRLYSSLLSTSPEQNCEQFEVVLKKEFVEGIAEINRLQVDHDRDVHQGTRQETVASASRN